MANLGGFQMKNIKRFPSMEYGDQGGTSATLWLDGKKIGDYIDYGDGGMEEVTYVSKEAEEKMWRFIVDFAKSHENIFIENLLNDRPEQYKQERDNFIKLHPYIPEEEVNIRVVASDSIVYPVSEFLKLADMEKFYKKMEKKGYRAVGTDEFNTVAYPKNWTDEMIMEDVGKRNDENAVRILHGDADKTEVYFSLDDFNISYEDMMKNVIKEQDKEQESLDEMDLEK